jgi:ABC-type phosphate transport system permease subunit
VANQMTADSRAVADELRTEPGVRFGEALIRLFVLVCGIFVVASTVLVIAFLARTGITGIRQAGLWQLVSHAVWKPEADLYGGLPLIVGTVTSATGAIFLGATPAVLSALWVVEFARASGG